MYVIFKRLHVCVCVCVCVCMYVCVDVCNCTILYKYDGHIPVSVTDA